MLQWKYMSPPGTQGETVPAPVTVATDSTHAVDHPVPPPLAPPEPVTFVFDSIKSHTPAGKATPTAREGVHAVSGHDAEADQKRREEEQKMKDKIQLEKGKGLYQGEFLTTARDVPVTLPWDVDRELYGFVEKYWNRLGAFTSQAQMNEEEYKIFSETVLQPLAERRDAIRYFREHKGITGMPAKYLQLMGQRLSGTEWRIFHNAHEASIGLIYLDELQWMVDYAGASGKPINDIAREFGFTAPDQEDIKRFLGLRKRVYKAITEGGKYDLGGLMDTGDAAFDPTVNAGATADKPDRQGRTRLVIHNEIVHQLGRLLEARGYKDYVSLKPEEKLLLRLEAARSVIYEHINGMGKKVIEAHIQHLQGEPGLQEALRQAAAKLRGKKEISDADKHTLQLAENEAKRKKVNTEAFLAKLKADRDRLLGTQPGQGLIAEIADAQQHWKIKQDLLPELKYDGRIRELDKILTALISGGTPPGDEYKDIDKKRKEIDELDAKIKAATEQKDRDNLIDQQKKLQKYVDDVQTNERKKRSDLEDKRAKLLEEIKGLEYALKRLQTTRKAIELNDLGIKEVPEGDVGTHNYSADFDTKIEEAEKAVETATYDYTEAHKATEGDKTEAETKEDEVKAKGVEAVGQLIFQDEHFNHTVGKVASGFLYRGGEDHCGPQDFVELMFGDASEPAVQTMMPKDRKSGFLSPVEYVLITARHYQRTGADHVKPIIDAADEIETIQSDIAVHRSIGKDGWDPKAHGSKSYDDYLTELNDKLADGHNKYAAAITKHLDEAVKLMRKEILWRETSYSSYENVGLVREMLHHIAQKSREGRPFEPQLYEYQKEEPKYIAPPSAPPTPPPVATPTPTPVVLTP